MDLDGVESFTPVRVLTFSGTNQASAVAASIFPNPFRDGDQLQVAVQLAQAGGVQVHMTDLLGREVANKVTTMAAGSATITVPQPQNLPAGLYVVRVTLPDGKMQQLKVEKK
ncbi:T9SS type A sorting domain-containing protein [Hymenobacter sp. BRD67]|uniref:T9SS type A sorting domain-containing protein n=1 Tax=Hymenobacter sp. BRD67 TaxID=2675877 RepID=UPI00156308B8|nr:T9SS type A sorting domain-containing protein [Hymenobacter sp. BRD67]QKG53776.1 T9SS type A sorting domain-containing protein [Hymenobacter sp. BRD67]